MTPSTSTSVRREDDPCEDLPMIGGWDLPFFEAEIRQWMKDQTEYLPAFDLLAIINETYLAWFEFEHIVNHVRKELTQQYGESCLSPFFAEVLDEDIDCQLKSFGVTFFGLKDPTRVKSFVEKEVHYAYLHFKQDAEKCPSYWAPRLLNKTCEYDEVAVTAEGATADEYKKIVADFTKGFECEILEIKRMQHYNLWREYAQKKLKICRANEKWF